jgi:hypothetical protein
MEPNAVENGADGEETTVYSEITTGEWTDTTEKGIRWKRNRLEVYDDSASVPVEKILRCPFGYGVTVFRVGHLPGSIDTEFANTTANAMSRVLTPDSPYGTRLMLGVYLDEHAPVQHRERYGGDVMLAVWGVDPIALEQLRDKIEQTQTSHRTRGTRFTMRMLATMPQFKQVKQMSKEYRCKLAVKVKEALGLTLPKADMPGVKWLPMHVGDNEFDYETVHLRFDRAAPSHSITAQNTLGGHTVQLFCDATHPVDGGAVFHSLYRGLTIFYPRSQQQTRRDYSAGYDVVIPASDGRILPLPATHETYRMVNRCCHVMPVQCPDGNTFDHVDCYEGSYSVPSPSVEAQYHYDLAHCARFHIAPVAFAVSSNKSRFNGKLYGHVPIDTMEQTLRNIQPDSRFFYMSDDADWQHYLKTILPDKNTMTFLSNTEYVTPILDENQCLTAYRIQMSYLRDKLSLDFL